MSNLCNHCEATTINGTRAHETGCQNTGERIELIDDGSLDTVFRCGKCSEEFRFNFALSDLMDSDETEDDDGDAYERFRFECLKECQDDHECFECRECGTYHDDEDDAANCCEEYIENSFKYRG